METMYDRLGDLLSQTLEAGHVKFVKPPQAEVSEEKKAESSNAADDNKDINAEIPRPEQKPKPHVKQMFSSGQAAGRQFNKPQATIIKAMSPELERACRLLAVPVGSSKEEIKKAYKEKLQYYHPDKHAGNAILEKVATDKTRQVMEAYALILKYL